MEGGRLTGIHKIGCHLSNLSNFNMLKIDYEEDGSLVYLNTKSLLRLSINPVPTKLRTPSTNVPVKVSLPFSDPFQLFNRRFLSLYYLTDYTIGDHYTGNTIYHYGYHFVNGFMLACCRDDDVQYIY